MGRYLSFHAQMRHPKRQSRWLCSVRCPQFHRYVSVWVLSLCNQENHNLNVRATRWATGRGCGGKEIVSFNWVKKAKYQGRFTKGNTYHGRYSDQSCSNSVLNFGIFLAQWKLQNRLASFTVFWYRSKNVPACRVQLHLSSQKHKYQQVRTHSRRETCKYS